MAKDSNLIDWNARRSHFWHKPEEPLPLAVTAAVSCFVVFVIMATIGVLIQPH